MERKLENQLGYNTFIDYGQLKEILNELIESNLLSHDSITRTFRTTEDGPYISSSLPLHLSEPESALRSKQGI